MIAARRGRFGNLAGLITLTKRVQFPPPQPLSPHHTVGNNVHFAGIAIPYVQASSERKVRPVVRRIGIEGSASGRGLTCKRGRFRPLRRRGRWNCGFVAFHRQKETDAVEYSPLRNFSNGIGVVSPHQFAEHPVGRRLAEFRRDCAAVVYFRLDSDCSLAALFGGDEG